MCGVTRNLELRGRIKKNANARLNFNISKLNSKLILYIFTRTYIGRNHKKKSFDEKISHR